VSPCVGSLCHVENSRHSPRRVNSEAATEDQGVVVNLFRLLAAPRRSEAATTATADSAVPQPITSYRSLITRNQGYGGVGLSRGVGRGRGVTLGVAVGVAVGVTLGVGVGVGEGVGATGAMAYA
jgi:hypothetical protein